MEVTRALARYLVNARYDDLPAAVRHEAARALLNFLGCAIGSARHETVARALAAVRPFSGTPQAAVLGRAERLDIMHAALVNGISAHVLDFDDTHARAIHPSAPVLPALIAFAEWRPITGNELIHAFVLGVEAEERVGLSVFPEHYAVGWHITGTAGVFGAAAAAGRLLGLDERQMCWALGTAATQAAGLREMFGTMCKSLHPGRAAQNGLMSALLAAKNFTSSEQAIEAPRGFGYVASTRFDPKVITEDLGKRYEILSNMYKPYACGLVVHAAIDGCIELAREHGLKPEQIERVDLTVSPLVLELTGKRRPQSGLEGKFSVFHAAAVGIIHGAAREAQFSDESVRDPRVVALRDADLDRDERLVLQCGHHAVERLIHLGPVRARLHRVEPARDIRIRGEIAPQGFSHGKKSRAKIVGNRDFPAAKVLVAADQVLIEDLEPFLALVLAPGNDAALLVLGRTFVMGKQLRVDQPVSEVSIELGVQPVHPLVHPRALPQVLGIGRRADLVSEILQNRGAFGKAEITVLEHRHHPARIQCEKRRLHMLAGHEINDLEFDVNVVISDEQHQRPAGGRDRVIVEFHAEPPVGCRCRRVPWRRVPAPGHLGYASRRCSCNQSPGMEADRTAPAPLPGSANPQSMHYPGPMTTVRLVLLAAIALLAWACAEPRGNPAAPGRGGPDVAIYLVAHEGHTGIVVPRAEIPAGLWPESRDFPGAEYLEVGWGDRDYYMGRDQGVWGTLRAGLWPTPSVLHVVGIRGSVAGYFRVSEVVELTLTREGFDRLVRYISDAHERVGTAPAAALGPGLYGESLFYPARESFHLFRTCNAWTARALRAGGLSINDSITSEGLMSQAREIGKVVNAPAPR